MLCVSFVIMEEALNRDLKGDKVDVQVCKVLDNEGNSFGIEPRDYSFYKYTVFGIITTVFGAFAVFFRPKLVRQELDDTQAEQEDISISRRVSIMQMQGGQRRKSVAFGLAI